MSTATRTKVEVYPEREYINKGIKEGWVTTQLVGMRNIIVDHEHYQARVIPLDMAHVKLLADTRTSQIDAGLGEYLFPIVVFETPKGKYLLADGFHRHEENRLRKGADIPAYVVKVKDWEHEARLYAAMCNRLALKQRSKEDVKKAVEILFADPVCWEWPCKRIGDHCSVSTFTVRKWKDEYSAKNHVELPEKTVRSDGRTCVAKNRQSTGRPSISCSPGGRYYTNIKGKSIYIGNDKSEAEEKAKLLIQENAQARRSLDKRVLLHLLISRHVVAESLTISFGGGSSNIAGVKSKSSFIIGATSDDGRNVLASSTGLRLLRITYGNPSDRLIVACYREDFPPQLIELLERDGIEFLAPDELVESLKPQGETEP